MCCGKMISAKMRALEDKELVAKNDKRTKPKVSFFKTRGRRLK